MSGDARNGAYQSGTFFSPLNRNPSNFNLSPDTKWWLQLQPNFGNQRDFVFEQLKALEMEFDCVASVDMHPSDFSEATTQAGQENGADPEKVSHPGFETPSRVSTTCLKHDFESIQNLKEANIMQPLKHDAIHSNHLKAELSEKMSIDQKQFDHLISNQREKDPFDVSMPWVIDKAGPWWRITDKDELASLVSQSSFRCIENCDLPRPQNAHSRSPLDIVEGFHDEEVNLASFDYKLCAVEGSQQNLVSRSANGAQWLSAELQPSARGLDKISSSFRESSKQSHGSLHNFEGDSSKVQLLEALCHSQTRAREAENAAQRAHSEKEHIIKLFLKQATHLFAYKQWFRLLQLESIYLQLKCKDNPMVPWDQLSALFPWLATKGEQYGEAGSKKRKRCSEHVHDVGKLALAMAVGMSLVGAGLFLGWTLGWLLPTV